MLRRLLFILLASLFLVAGSIPVSPDLRAEEGGKEARRSKTVGEIRFLVLGDWGRRGEARQREVARRMGEHAAERRPDFVISTGDNFYDNGVSRVDDENWRRSFQEVYTSPFLDIPWYPVLGNHDYRGNTQAQIDYSLQDRRWSMAGRYYALEKPVGDEKALFIFLDTNPFIKKYHRWRWRYPDLDSQNPATQLQWLERILAESKAMWIIAVGHHPLISSGVKHGSTPELQSLLQPLFDKYGVHLYFSGHDHNLQHLKPPGVTHYVISGGGSRVRPVGEHKSVLFARGAAGFVSAVLTMSGIELEFIGDEGTVLYRADITPQDISQEEGT